MSAPCGARPEWRDRLFPPNAPSLGRCACGAEVRADSFRDLRSRAEFRIAGRCQACQDAFFLATTDRDDLVGHRFALRAGLVVGHRFAGDALAEVAVLPFLFTAPGREVAWEARYIVRAGSSLEPCEPWDELAALRDVLAEHQIRVASVDSVDAAQLGSAFAASQVAFGDPSVFGRLAAASVAAPGPGPGESAPLSLFPVRLADLAATVARLGLDPEWPGGCASAVPSALRVCAWIGGFLAEGAIDEILAACYSDRGERLPRGVLS